MALTDIQKTHISKDALYSYARSRAREINDFILRTGEEAEWLNRATSGDLDDLLIPAPEQVTLSQLRGFLNELVSLFEGNAVTPANDPQEIINKLRPLT